MALGLKKKWWCNRLYIRLLLIAVLILVLLLGVSVFQRYTIERATADRLNASQAELQSLKEREAAIEEKVEYLQNDSGIEAEIRKHFDVAKEGEQVVVLVNEPEVIVEEPEVEIVQERPWWDRIFSSE